MTKQSSQTEYIVSKRLADGTLIEAVMQPDGSTALVIARDGQVEIVERLKLDDTTYLPIPPHNNLLRHRVVLLPPLPAEPVDPRDLVSEVSAFVTRYVTFSDAFNVVAAHYVLLSWVYDAFRELPYLRVRGDYGCGKTRALQVIGHLLYKPVFASGATTVSPIFHKLDLFRGSLVLDEADFRFYCKRSRRSKQRRCQRHDAKKPDCRCNHIPTPRKELLRPHARLKCAPEQKLEALYLVVHFLF